MARPFFPVPEESVPRKYLETMITPSALAAQERAYGAARPVAPGAAAEPLGPAEIEFIAGRDSFYMATVGETGWPYVQHRGGPPGFLSVVDDSTLAFADLRGNRQLISTGNLATDDRVSLFLMDYPGRRRLKILGRATITDARDEPARSGELAPAAAPNQVERLFRIEVVGFDWNCPQHITPRYTAEQVEAYVVSLKERIAALEAAQGPD